MHARVVVVREGAVLASWRIEDDARVDVGLVERLARVALVARRHGCTVELTDVSDELRGVLDLVGLGVEVGGEPEGREQGGVDEAVVADDPVA